MFALLNGEDTSVYTFLYMYLNVFVFFLPSVILWACKISKKSSDLLQCLPGFDGGMNQTFHILVKERNTHQVGNNLVIVMIVLVMALVMVVEVVMVMVI